MKLLSLFCVAVIALFSLQAFAGEFPPDAQKMLRDLGTPDVQQMNNGRTLPCQYGGKKTVTISPLADATFFSGDYDNCREAGSTRDGLYELIVRDWEIVEQSSKRSKNGELQDAARAGDVKKVRALIAKGADVNYAENITLDGGGTVDGWTPLMSAAISGNSEMLKLLLKAGAWVNFMNSRVTGALWLAANNGNAESVKLLLASRAHINNANDENITPLMTAAMVGNFQAARVLVEAGAALNMTHKDGDSALMFALAGRHTDVARLLIDSGADINIRNRFGATALLIAVAEGNEELVSLLVQKKADLTAKTEGGKTALDIAIAKGNERIIGVLSEK